MLLYEVPISGIERVTVPCFKCGLYGKQLEVTLCVHNRSIFQASKEAGLCHFIIQTGKMLNASPVRGALKDRSIAGVAGSNHAEGMNVLQLYLLCVV